MRYSVPFHSAAVSADPAKKNSLDSNKIWSAVGTELFCAVLWAIELQHKTIPPGHIQSLVSNKRTQHIKQLITWLSECLLVYFFKCVLGRIVLYDHQATRVGPDNHIIFISAYWSCVSERGANNCVDVLYNELVMCLLKYLRKWRKELCTFKMMYWLCDD